jgi:hypothetical protein
MGLTVEEVDWLKGQRSLNSRQTSTTIDLVSSSTQNSSISNATLSILCHRELPLLRPQLTRVAKPKKLVIGWDESKCSNCGSLWMCIPDFRLQTRLLSDKNFLKTDQTNQARDIGIYPSTLTVSFLHIKNPAMRVRLLHPVN